MARAKGRRSNRRQQIAGAEASVGGAAAAASVHDVPPLRRPPLGAIVLVIVAIVVAFGGAIAGPFQFDDVASIPRNVTIERLWPPSAPLHPPSRAAVSGRPAVNYSLAVNHAINRLLGVAQTGGAPAPLAPIGYRITNILIHLLSGLLLFGVIRRTARRVHSANWSLSPDELAALVTVIWLVHPLQTEAVDYIIQRTELLVSLCYLATLYASIRAWDAGTRRAIAGWSVASVVACFVGMASKEVMGSAPLAVMLYDRAFRATSWRDVVRHPGRRWLYVGLFATWTVLVASIVGGARADSVGFGHGMAWYEYLYSQAWAILRYLQLTLWPDRLVFDYGASPIRGLRGVPGLIALSAAAVATAVAWKRAAWIGFLGTWFFMLLAPSSSVVPIQTEIAAERRVYLALVPVLILIVVGIETLRRRIAARRSRALLGFLIAVGIAYFLSSGWTGALVASSVASGASVAIMAIAVRTAITAVACLIGWRLVTAQDPRPVLAALLVALIVRAGFRSRAYSDAEGLWRDAAAKVPDNPRAYDNLAAAIIQKDSSRTGDAEQAFRAALAIDSTYVTAWTNLADVELKRGRTTEGRALLERAIAINPDFVDANERLGGVLVKLGEHQRAISYLERATNFRPTDESLGTLAIAYLALGRRDEAKTALLKAVALNPRRADALGYLAAMFAEEGRPGDALGYVEAAIRAGATTPASYALLSYTYAQLQRPDDAARAASTAATSAGDNATIFLQLSAAMTIAQRPADVERYLARAVEIEPRNPESITRLGLAKAQNGQMAEAAALFRRALTVQPGYEPAQRALARVPATLQRD